MSMLTTELVVIAHRCRWPEVLDLTSATKQTFNASLDILMFECEDMVILRLGYGHSNSHSNSQRNHFPQPRGQDHRQTRAVCRISR